MNAIDDIEMLSSPMKTVSTRPSSPFITTMLYGTDGFALRFCPHLRGCSTFSLL